MNCSAERSALDDLEYKVHRPQGEDARSSATFRKYGCKFRINCMMGSPLHDGMCKICTLDGMRYTEGSFDHCQSIFI